MEWMIVTDASQAAGLRALRERGEADCRHNVFINEGDAVYLFGKEEGCVLCKCRVTAEGVAPETALEPVIQPVTDANNRENAPHHMRLKLLCCFPEGALPLKELLEHGLPNVEGSTLIRPALLAYLQAAEN